MRELLFEELHFELRGVTRSGEDGSIIFNLFYDHIEMSNFMNITSIFKLTKNFKRITIKEKWSSVRLCLLLWMKLRVRNLPFRDIILNQLTLSGRDVLPQQKNSYC